MCITACPIHLNQWQEEAMMREAIMQAVGAMSLGGRVRRIFTQSLRPRKSKELWITLMM